MSLFEKQIRSVPLEACYARAEISEYQGNPLIEALPRIKSDESWVEYFTSLPSFDESDLSAPPHVRVYLVHRIKELFIPFPYHIEFARRLDYIIRNGYKNRAPSTSRNFELQGQYVAMQRGETVECPRFEKFSSIASSSLFGMSGMGKSTTVEMTLASYPQWIYHPGHNLSQIVWLKIECPKDGSLRELSISILKGFDSVLGSSYAARHESGSSEQTILNEIQLLCLQHNLGLLVIDELQNLCVKRSGGREEMLNFFQGLVNELRIPIFLMGTHKSETLLPSDVRHSRRKAITGSFSWKNLPNGPLFTTLLNGLWRYQYSGKKSELTQELIDVIYEETQGVVAFVVDMFVVAQIHALRGKGSAVTAELFRNVARKEFECVQGFLNALRSKDPNRIKKYEDAISYDLRDILEEAERFVPSFSSHIQSPVSDPSATVVTQACEVLMTSLSLSEEEAKELIALVRTGHESSYQAIVKAATAAYYSAD